MDFEKFFDTERFETMAREYSKKYKKASVFGENKKDERLKESVKKAFSKAFCLFYMFERELANKNDMSQDVLMGIHKCSGDMREFLKRHFEGNSEIVFDKPRVISHKSCVFALLDMVHAFFECFEIIRLSTEETEKELYIELKSIYSSILSHVKTFYIHI